MKKAEYDYGDKRKLTEIKKKFKIDQFTKILDSKDNPSIFSTLEEITKVDISIDDEFTNKIGLVNFFKKISVLMNLSYSNKSVNLLKKHIFRYGKPDIVHVHNTFPLWTYSIFKYLDDIAVKYFKGNK